MILDEILRHKKKEVAALKKRRSLESVRRAALALPKKRFALSAALKAHRGTAVIAEIKRRSPSRGLLKKDFRPLELARAFQAGGAVALSVLTDRRYFGGSPAYLARVKRAVRIPVLRKDFLIDEYQIYESRLLGADAVLLIAAALETAPLERLYGLARALGLDALVEVHTGPEARRAAALGATLVGINNRDLKSFRVDKRVTGRLKKRLPAGTLVVAESGIESRKDLLYLDKIGVRAALVGEGLMRRKDPRAAVRELLGKG
ncbi:MAG: hypothetical protein A3D28_05520 [Omnitrophica bacterium RIFCSPHIGHO2_02_FULL_63_14]|nr:MAG: hypothetical protein A3D28_05520 [Omnitrophica bacterium RIFCSPHIGHO2_02_FULL_63_14]